MSLEHASGDETRVTRDAPIRIAFVLTGLPVGGAEMMLWKLTSRIDRSRFRPAVFTLASKPDALLPRFRLSGIDCHSAEMTHAQDALRGLYRLVTKLRRFEPDIIQGWMYQGNLAASFASLCGGPRAPVLWSVRAGLTALSGEKWQVALPMWIGGKLSFWPHSIINNSETSALEHEQQLGYRGDRRVIVPNGFDTEVFKPSDETRARVRRELGIGTSAVLVGLVGRYHPVKNHAGFVRAAAIVSRRFPNVHYVVVGDGVDSRNAALTQLLAAHELTAHAHLLGCRDDMETCTAALDVVVSCSTAEAFPNVVGEAMSCAVPCVVTDVGDSAAVVGPTGRVVPPRDDEALAAAIEALVGMSSQERAALGRAARDRIVENYSLASVVQRYEALYSQVHAAVKAH